MARLPVFIVVGTVWCYWLSVLIMIVRSHLLHRTSAGALPRTGLERWMWIAWVPTVLAWLVVPVLAHLTSWAFVQVPSWSAQNSYLPIDWLAAGTALLAYVLTVPCWLTLGSNWSLAVVPDKDTMLVARGLFRWVRHPIYALGLLLIGATVAVAPSPAMVVVALIHLSLIHLKCRSEEAFLRVRHGQAYEEFCRRRGRFWPRWRTGIDAESQTTIGGRNAA